MMMMIGIYCSNCHVALQMCGTCLTFPTQGLYDCMMRVLVYLSRTRNRGCTFNGKCDAKQGRLHAYADSDWSMTRSLTGFLIMLAGAAIVCGSRRQHWITLSSCEAELMALAECAIELIYVKELLAFIGYEHIGAIDCYTDNKGAHDICNRMTSTPNSKHVDRKVFKMRELRGAGMVTVTHVSTDKNPSDIFTKIVTRQVFERHLELILNKDAGKAVDDFRSARAASGATITSFTSSRLSRA